MGPLNFSHPIHVCTRPHPNKHVKSTRKNPAVLYQDRKPGDYFFYWGLPEHQKPIPSFHSSFKSHQRKRKTETRDNSRTYRPTWMFMDSCRSENPTQVLYRT